MSETPHFNERLLAILVCPLTRTPLTRRKNASTAR